MEAAGFVADFTLPPAAYFMTQAISGNTTLIQKNPAMSAFRSSDPGSPIVLLSVLLSILFLAAGSASIAEVAQIVTVFDKISVGQDLRNVMTAIEFIGAIGLLLGVARFYAAALLACLMLVAAVEHLFAVAGDPAPAIVLFLLTTIVAHCTRPAATLPA